MSLLDTASLIVTPNGYKEGKLYSVIPSDGSGDLSVTRATTATRVNSAGLVELVPYNLLTYSEDFSNAAWSKTALSVSTNSTTAPNGLNTADTLTNTSGSAIVLQASTAVNTSAVVTFSTYFKKTNNDWVAVNIARNGATTYGELYVWFNLSTGAVGSNLPDGAAVLVDTDIENVGNGWYRCSVTGYVPNAVSYQGFLFFPDGNGSFNRVTSQSVYAWGAQLVEGSTALPYQKTETRLNIPRLDYSNGTCPSILVEPQRTNLALWSSSFDNAYWAKINSGTSTIPVVTANSAISPDGTQNADRVQCSANTSSASNFSLIATNVNAVLSSTGTATIWLKSNTSSNQNVLMYWNGGQGQVFNVTPEWQRFTLNNLSATTSSLLFGTRGGSGFFYTGGDATLDILAYGAQLEVGSYPTSYIPTTSASVTRNADVISKTGISSLIGQTEGVIFLDFVLKNPLAATNRIFSLTETDWLFGGSIRLDITSSSFVLDIAENTATSAQITYNTTPQQNTRYKVAIAYKQNDCKLFINGIDAGSDTSTIAMPTCSELYLNALGGGFNAPYEASNINAVALWKTRLTNDELASLTTI